MYRDTMSIWEGPIPFAYIMLEHNRIEKERVIQKLSCIHPKYDYPYIKLNIVKDKKGDKKCFSINIL